MKKTKVSISLLTFALFFLPIGSALAQKQVQKQASPKLNSPEFEDALRVYIINHPEVVLESIRLFQERVQLEKAQASKDAIAAHRAELLSDFRNPTAQPAVDAVTVVEFFDYRCGYCRKVQNTVEKFGGAPKVRIVYKELPILGPDSLYASKAALAAREQGAYLQLHEALMNSPEPVTPAAVDRIAGGMGLDMARLKKDMESPQIADTLAKNDALAEALGVRATPTFVVGKEISSGALTPEALQKMIDSAQNKPMVAQGPANSGSF